MFRDQGLGSTLAGFEWKEGQEHGAVLSNILRVYSGTMIQTA